MYFLNSRAERALLAVAVDEDIMGWAARSESDSLPSADNVLDVPAADWGRPRSLRNEGGHAMPSDVVLRSIFAIG